MPTREQKQTMRGEKCIMLGIGHNLPSGMVRSCNEKTGKIVHRQNAWYREADDGSAGAERIAAAT